MTNTALDYPSKESHCLIQFMYGDPVEPTWALYTDDQSTQHTFLGPHTSTPAMKINVPEITALLKEKPAKLIMQEDAFLLALSKGGANSPTSCFIWEVNKTLGESSQDTKTLMLFRGRVSRSVRNYKGKSGSVLVEIKNWKSRLDLPINPGVVEHHCGWPLFGGKCALGLTASAFEKLGTIDAVDGKVLTVDGTNITLNPDRWWHRGTVKFNGLELGIREWRANNPTKLFLVREAPPEWVGETATFLPGCDNLYSSCRDKFANEQFFMGPGFAVPDYMPLLETGRAG